MLLPVQLSSALLSVMREDLEKGAAIIQGPIGGWLGGDHSEGDLLDEQARVQRQLAGTAPWSEGMTPGRSAAVNAVMQGIGLPAGFALAGAPKGLTAAMVPVGALSGGLGGYFGTKWGLNLRQGALEKELAKKKAPPVAAAVPKDASAPEAATAASKLKLPKGTLKTLGIAAGGALAYDQGTKAVGDWKSGRELRRQQALYR